MENRFTLKDFALFILIVLLILLVVLAMKQYDRQWQDLQALNERVKQIEIQQTRMTDKLSVLDKINARLQNGVIVNNGQAATADNDSSFNKALHGPVLEAQQASDYASGDWLVDAFPAKVSKITPLIYEDYYATVVHEYVFEPLIRPDLRTGEIIPILAESWTVEDNSEDYKVFEDQVKPQLLNTADKDPSVYQEQFKRFLEAYGDNAPQSGSVEYARLRNRAKLKWVEDRLIEHPDRPTPVTITFKLRPDLRFSDGHPLTSEDVVFTFDFMNNPKIDCPVPRQFYDNIESATANGPLEVTFKFKTPHYAALSFAGWRDVIPKHFYEKYVGREQEFNENPGLVLGSGPYRMKSPTGWRTGEPIELFRNERYWGPKPAIEKILWKQIDDDKTRYVQFVNGQLDFLIATPEQYDTAKNNPDVASKAHMFNFVKMPSGYRYIAWNQERNGQTLFTDKRIRQAMTFLTPRERLCKEVYKGYAVPGVGPWLQSSPQSDPSLKPRPYDPRKGLEILKSLDWIDTNGDGILDKNGKPFSFELSFPANSEIGDKTALILKDIYAQYGIQMKLNPVDWLSLTKKVENRDFDAVFMGWGGGAVESDIRQMFHSSQIGRGADNYMSYANPELDRLIDEARTTINYEKRMKLWQACHRLLYEDQPYTFVYVPQRTIMINKRFQNVKKLKMNINDKWEWYVPAALQKYQ